MEKIDVKLLEGLTFRTSEPKKVKKDGVEKTQYIPVERPLKPDDVLDWKDMVEDVIVVVKDGKKHRIPKDPAKRAALKKKEEDKEKK